MYYLYIIKSNLKDWKYIGIAQNIEKRLKAHNAGYTKSTKAYRPFSLVHLEKYAEKQNARKRELFLKNNFKAREELYNKL